MLALPCAIALALSVSAVAQNFPASKALDDAINQAIKEGRLPGAVLLVGHNGRIVYEKAYGERSDEPDHEPMTLDTIFDLASLTKVIATTSCLMKLYEEGKFRLNDRVTEYIPEFQGGRSEITLRDLMTHFSGLRPDVPLRPAWTGYETGINLACTTPPELPPGHQHVYSDINFELLGELVHRLSGQMENDYVRQNIFIPLGMKDTMYLPPADLIPRIAPTEEDPATGKPFRGVVHDPTARDMGGVAGHAGLFSTAQDLSRFAQMMLNEGELGGRRFFNALTIEKFIEPQTPPDQPILRGLGWDIDSPYSSNRGELFPIGSYGHTGFTGTSIWIDPTSKTYVILLANAVHPHGRPPIVGLRSRVATIVAAAVGIKRRGIEVTGYEETRVHAGRGRTINRNGETLTGLDVLEAQGFDQLKGKKVGLITNQSGLDKQGKRNIDVMKAAGVNITALFSPEHGFFGAVDHPGIQDTTDPTTGIPVYSLYGHTMRPTAEMLQNVDALVYDIQDVGVRFYTFETTMAYCMEAAAKAHIPFVVLDRPNPITGTRVEGPLLDKDKTSFVGFMPGIPVRHGMTMGELAQMENGELKIGANLHVVPMEDWHRGDWFDSCDLPWINPSPNMRSLNAAMLYPGLCFLESQHLSVGRGTDSPYEQIAAPYIDGPALASTLNKRNIPGVRVYPTSFTPADSNFKGEHIQGVRFVITDRDRVDATLLGLEVAAALQKLYPDKVDWNRSRLIIGNDDVIRRLKDGEYADDIEDTYQDGVKDFLKIREKYLIYR